MTSFNSSSIETTRNEIYILEGCVKEKEDLLTSNELSNNDIAKIKGELQELNDLIDKKEQELEELENDEPIFDIYGKLVID